MKQFRAFVIGKDSFQVHFNSTPSNCLVVPSYIPSIPVTSIPFLDIYNFLKNRIAVAIYVKVYTLCIYTACIFNCVHLFTKLLAWCCCRRRCRFYNYCSLFVPIILSLSLSFDSVPIHCMKFVFCFLFVLSWFLSWLMIVLIYLLPFLDVTASRDLNDYVITENWRDVEQALPGDTKILPIFFAWGSIKYEVWGNIFHLIHCIAYIYKNIWNRSSTKLNHINRTAHIHTHNFKHIHIDYFCVKILRYFYSLPMKNSSWTSISNVRLLYLYGTIVLTHKRHKEIE